MVKPLVSIIMGSDSDLNVMREAGKVLKEFKIPFEITIVSAHRTPKRLVEFAEKAHERGIQVIIAGAGGAAHLPGMVAAISPLPIIGVPVKSSNSLDGWDSVLSILQMPGGVPVATVALNNAKNAGLLAIQILSVNDKKLREKMISYKEKLNSDVLKKIKNVENHLD
jgi:5-(carboxyamino)imidazole ribonucleotide mutase